VALKWAGVRTPRQRRALWVIEHSRTPVPVVDIAKATGLQPKQVRDDVRRLRNLGLIERADEPTRAIGPRYIRTQLQPEDLARRLLVPVPDSYESEAA
jgi:predicted transcriptional regulator